MRGFDVSCLSGSLTRFVGSCVCRLYSGMFIGVERCGSLSEAASHNRKNGGPQYINIAVLGEDLS